ncbi:MAG TPA: FIST N-terminal domain-containing protein [Acidimicrobiales bacterium]|nr:FIST N-terminal domain-containing protein [Acidimicrobiales bacterium]
MTSPGPPGPPRPFAAALSEHPVTAHAVGEVVGQVLEGLDGPPDLALLFVTAPHSGALEDALGVVAATLSPTSLLGCAAESVAGPGREVELRAAVSLWAGRVGPTVPFELTAPAAPTAPWGLPDDLPLSRPVLLVLADPFTFPAEDFLAAVDATSPGARVVGGLASAARGAGGNRLGTAARVLSAGAVGVALDGAMVDTVVSQGCRPVGRPWVVTRSEGRIIYELGGRPALSRLMDMAGSELDESGVSVVNAGGLQIGLVVDEHKAEFGPGDFLIRTVLGADREIGAVAVGEEVTVGTTVQFHLRDASTADEDMRSSLAGAEADAALLFTCNGRGSRLFRRPDHDASVLGEALDGAPVAGMFAAGELGPVGGRNFVHGMTASMALFRAAP